MTERVIRVTIDPATGPGAAKVGADLGKIDTGIKRVRDSQGRLRDEQGRFFSDGSRGFSNMAKQSADLATRFKQLVTVGAFFQLARQTVGLADEYTRLTNQLKLVTTSSENLAAVQGELFRLAQETRSPLESTATLYAKIARNAAELGLGQQEVLGITKAVNQAIQVGGGTAAEASAGVIQFAQALASGVLRGDELRSILENMPRLAQGLAQGLGVSIGELRELGEAGALTSEKVIGALQKTAPGIAKEFAALTPTIGSAFTTLRNSAVSFIGSLGQMTGASTGFAELIQSLSGGLDQFARAILGTLDPTEEVSGAVKVLATAFVVAYAALEPFITAFTGVFKTAFVSIGKLLGGFAATLVAFFSGDFRAANQIAGETINDFYSGVGDGLQKTGEEIVADMSSRIETLAKLWDEGARRAQPAQERLLNPGAGKKGGGQIELEEYTVVNAERIGPSANEALNRELEEATRTADERRLSSYYETTEQLRDLRERDLIDEITYQNRKKEALDELLPEVEITVKRIQEKGTKAFDPLLEFSKQAARNIQSAFAEFLFDPFEDGLDGLLQNFLTTMQKIAAEAAAAKALQALGNLFAGSGNGYLSAFGKMLGGRANGGSVQAGVPVMVNEKASQARRPEIFVPPSSGRIVQAGQVQAPAPIQPPDNIFVRDESEIPNAIASRRGRSALVTTVSNYQGEFRRALGIG